MYDVCYMVDYYLLGKKLYSVFSMVGEKGYF